MPSYDVVHWSAYQAQRTATIQNTINFSFKMTITFVLCYLLRSADKG